jgi:CPA2 family monovalent cation:H+ antiporter-2
MTGSLSLGEVGQTLGRLSLFLVATLVAGLIAIPRFLTYVARFRSPETLLITVLGLCFGVSLLALKLGYSVALGAFLIGAVIAESREIHRIESLIEPIRDMFSAVFFVAIGLMIDPALLAEHWKPILVISLAVVVGQILSCTFGTFLSGNDTRTSLRVGMGLAQIGEFSFIIASLGQTLNVTSKFLYPIAVAVSVLTTLLTPYLIRGSDSVALGFERACVSLKEIRIACYAIVERPIRWQPIVFAGSAYIDNAFTACDAVEYLRLNLRRPFESVAVHDVSHLPASRFPVA